MKIKEFFENCTYCYHVYFEIVRSDDSQKEVRVINGQEMEVHNVENREIYTREDFNNFIKDYGDEEFNEWSVEYRVECTQFHFFL